MTFDSNDVLIAFCIIVLIFLAVFVYGLVEAIHMVELSVMPAIWTMSISTHRVKVKIHKRRSKCK